MCWLESRPGEGREGCRVVCFRLHRTRISASSRSSQHRGLTFARLALCTNLDPPTCLPLPTNPVPIPALPSSPTRSQSLKHSLLLATISLVPSVPMLELCKLLLNLAGENPIALGGYG